MLTLVTGTTGQVGRRFVPRLLAQARPAASGYGCLVRDAARGEPVRRAGRRGRRSGTCATPRRCGKAVAGVDAVRERRGLLPRGAGRGGVGRQPGRRGGTGPRRAGRGRAAVRAGQHGPGVRRGTGPPAGRGGRDPARRVDVGRLPRVEGGGGTGTARAGRGMDVRVGRLAFVYGEGDPHLAQSLRWAGGWAAAPAAAHGAPRGRRPGPVPDAARAGHRRRGSTTSPTTPPSRRSNCTSSTGSRSPPNCTSAPTPTRGSGITLHRADPPGARLPPAVPQRLRGRDAGAL